jgi:DNA-binding GntR family transcriptional regulator
VSRTPVREALSRLTAQGILVAADKRGLRVTEYTREQLAQIFEAMYEIEAVCARLASQRLTLLARSEIEAAQARCVEVAEPGISPAYLRANEALHLAIYKRHGQPLYRRNRRRFPAPHRPVPRQEIRHARRPDRLGAKPRGLLAASSPRIRRPHPRACATI